MEKIWLKNYPKNVPAEIDPNCYSSLLDMFNQTVQVYRDRPAVTGLDITLTYNQLNQTSEFFAAYLQKLGLKKGDRIALMMPNIVQYSISAYGAFKAGLVIVNVNPLYTERELEHQLKDAKPEAIVVLENFAKTVELALPHVQLKHVIVARISDLMPMPKAFIVNWVMKYIKKAVPDYKIKQVVYFKQALTIGKKSKFISVSLSHNDLAFLQYTGGTTGISKGAMLSHGNMVAN